MDSAALLSAAQRFGSNQLRKARLASDDLRHALVAHAHDPGNRRHWQSLAVGSADRLVPLVAQLGDSLVERGFALGIRLGEGCQACSGVWGLAFGSGDFPIV